MQYSKIRLSPTELALVCDAEIILTKNTIIRKAIGLLESIQEQLVAESEESRNESFFLSVSPKISRGENYLGLPYVILDFPRVHRSGYMAFISSMLWWGNLFSST